MKLFIKRIHLGLIIFYLAIAIYFALFNWDIFSVDLPVNTGFAVINIPLLAMIFSFSLLVLLIQFALKILSNIFYERDLNRKEKDFKTVKAKLHDRNAPEIENIATKLENMDVKLVEIFEAVSKEKKEPEEKTAEENETSEQKKSDN